MSVWGWSVKTTRSLPSTLRHLDIYCMEAPTVLWNLDLTQTWVRNKELCVSPRGQILKYMQRLSLHTLTGTINLIIVYPKNVSKSINILLKLFHSRVFVGLGFEKSLTQMPRQRKLLNCGRCFNLWGPLFPWDQEAPACVLHLWYVR